MNGSKRTLPERVSPSDLARFWNRIAQPESPDGCMVWTGNAAFSYWVGGTTVDARRFIFVYEGGVIPDGFKLWFPCPTAGCITPSHMELRRKGNGVRHNTKVCSDCGIEKQLGDFSPCSTGSQGRFNYCKACFRDRKRAEYRAKPKRERNAMVLARYGLTRDDYERMAFSQGGLCAICGGVGGVYGLVVDHDHDTGTIRDLLCGSCNAGIAMFKHDPAVMKGAIRYAQKWAAIIASQPPSPCDTTARLESVLPEIV